MRHSLSDGNFPQALKNMPLNDLELLSYDIRQLLLDTISQTGGHLASNLGIVELTIALHQVFDSPVDKIVWDVGHQTYVHKILTGRADELSSLRQYGGLSGFPRRCESPHDMYESGHSSASISAAFGYAAARDLRKEQYSVIAVIGDGALTGGISYEAMNNVGQAETPMIVILNDNEMSISQNVGGMSAHLGKLRASQAYLEFKKKLKNKVQSIPRYGSGIYDKMEHLRDMMKYAIVPGAVFEELGFKYFGPIDGHSIKDLIEAMNLAKDMQQPVLLHVVTKKGKGYRNAENNPGKFHGVSPFDLTTGAPLSSSNLYSYSQVFGTKMLQLAKRDERIVAVSAAMVDATGLAPFHREFPERLFDVGIAEQHAVSFAAGLALNGMRPVVAIYSTFLQRAYDEILIDVCMQKLPVIFAIDRAGNVGNDGETHHGQFDLSYLSHMPNMTVLAPKDGRELASMMDYALTLSGPCAIRYPRGEVADFSGLDFSITPIDGKMEILQEGKDVYLLAVGKMVFEAAKAARILKERGLSVGVVNVRTVKPLDRDRLLELCRGGQALVTIEDNSIIGGFGASVCGFLAEINHNHIRSLLQIGWPDTFITHGDTKTLMKEYGMDAVGIAERVVHFLEG